MSDPKVKQVQDWLLETYGNRSEFSNFVTSSGFQANGNTGNNTMTALVFALQYELGISQPSGNFGPTTINLSPKISFATAANYSKNIIKILEGGLWCHGYSAGYSEPEIPLFGGVEFGGTYDEDTDKAVKQLQKDIGISQSGRFDGYLWKALLSTDAFVTTWTNGSAKIREAQQYLNALAINGYYFADDFIGGYLPTDGLNNRAFSKALILYIQAIQGIYASEATGNLGPSTQANLVNIPDGLPSETTKSRHFVRAAVFALLANGYDLTINSYWSQETSSVVSQFQKDMALPVTGKIDLTTWMSLLVSHGNPNRPFSVIDTRFEITEERLEVIKNMGIKAVGRYINGTEFKVLRKNEFKRLIDNGIGLIPIYQQNALSSDDFSLEAGVEQGRNAQMFAKDFKIPKKSIIYFAVDYDAQDWEITNYIIPYFRGVLSMCKTYKVGVYGTRNVCQRLADAGLTVSSYVSNMSSGFSGNLGFKMPSNWNFDQFNETRVSDFDIDKVGYSGKNGYVTEYGFSFDIEDSEISLTNPTVVDLINKIKILEELAEDFLVTKIDLVMELGWEHKKPSFMILNYLRYFKYSTGLFAQTLGISNTNEVGFYDYILEKAPNLHTYFSTLANTDLDNQMIKDSIGGKLDLGHFAFTTLCYAVPELDFFIPKFWTGWGGDSATLAAEISLLRPPLAENIIEMEKIQAEQIERARKLLGTELKSTFSLADMCSDLDSIYIGNKLNQEMSKNNYPYLSNVMEEYYNSLTSSKRVKNWLVDLNLEPNGIYSHRYITEVVLNKFNGLLELGLWFKLGDESKPIDQLAIADSISNYILVNL